MEIKTAYLYGDDGYFLGEIIVQIGDGIYLPDHCTLTAPADYPNDSVFYKWNGGSWDSEQKPKTAGDCVGSVIPNDSQSAHDIEMRLLMEDLCNGSTEYWVKRGSDLSWAVEKIPDPSLDEVRKTKLVELDAAFMTWYEKDATVTSSLGFVADSDSRAIMDVSGLVTALEAQPAETRGTVAFMDHENTPHTLTLDQLKTVRLEIIQNGQSAYAQKWSYRTQIENAESVEALQAMSVEFTGEDFSNAAS